MSHCFSPGGSGSPQRPRDPARNDLERPCLGINLCKVLTALMENPMENPWKTEVFIWKIHRTWRFPWENPLLQSHDTLKQKVEMDHKYEKH